MKNSHSEWIKVRGQAKGACLLKCGAICRVREDWLPRMILAKAETRGPCN